MTAEYQEYPITMIHPSYKKPEIVNHGDGRNGLFGSTYSGKGEMLAPTTALDAEQEEYWKAQGYERAGKVDPSAWVQAHTDGPPDTYVPQEYPKFVYGVLVNSREEEGALHPVEELWGSDNKILDAIREMTEDYVRSVDNELMEGKPSSPFMDVVEQQTAMAVALDKALRKAAPRNKGGRPKGSKNRPKPNPEVTVG